MKTQLIEVTPANVEKEGIFCLKNVKNPGFGHKLRWFESQYEKGMRMIIARDSDEKDLGFIEYAPAEMSWRPVDAPGYLFIHCLWVYPSKAQNQGVGRKLVEYVLNEARKTKKAGVAVMTSEGTWMVKRALFERLGFAAYARKDRFELWATQLDHQAPEPRFLDWEKNLSRYNQGWYLIYANQCPMHGKSAADLTKVAQENGIDLWLEILDNPEEAHLAPSGFGTFSLVHDGKLLADHYISKTRFRNILKSELAFS